LANICLKGKVYTGKGEGKKFVTLPWVEHQIKEKLGFVPFAGTLNIRLNREGLANKKMLTESSRIEITPEKGYCKGVLIKAKITGLDCAVIIPLVEGYPPDVVEVISPVFLRQRLNLADGCETAVMVSL
jgi:CTP-dependent riboflavin kinase